MRGFTRHAAINGLKPALEALIKMVDHRFVYNKKKQPIFRPTVFQGVTNMNQPNKERIANAPARCYD